MFSITPIGSCRIASPLKLCEDIYGYRTNRSRSYGFSHSSAEVVQQLRFMAGEVVPPKDVWRFIARGVDREDMLARDHTPSDLYVIEISSAKQISLDGWLIQLNYLVNQMQDFFSSKDRAAGYWRVIDRNDQNEIDSYLAETFSSAPVQIENSAILRRIRRSLTTLDELRADVSFIIEHCARTLFVTHVNALRPDETPIPSREALIGDVETAVRDCGGNLYNPTERMIELTQPVAIEDHSYSLAHYTPEFSRIIVDDWFDSTIAGMIDDIAMTEEEGRITDIFTPHFDALIVNGMFEGLEDRLLRLQRQHPISAALMELLCKLYLSQNKVNEGLSAAKAMVAAQPDDLQLRARFVEVAIELGQYDDAIISYHDLAQADYPVSAHRLYDFGQRAEHDGFMSAAISFYGLALARNQTHSAAAIALGALLLSSKDKSLWDILPEPVQTIALSQFGPTALIGVTDMIDENISQHIATKGLPAEDLVTYVDHLNGSHLTNAAANLVAQWCDENCVSNPAHARLREIFDDWFKQSEAAKSLGERLEWLNAILTAQPKHAQARMAMRDIRLDLLSAARDFAAKKDRQNLQAMAQQIAGIFDNIPEIDLYRARLAFEETDYEEALVAGQKAAAGFKDNVALWALLMRSAFNLNDYFKADRFAQEVIVCSDADTARLESEAQQRRDRMPILCYRAAREETDSIKLAALYGIAQRHEEYGDDALQKKRAAQTATINTLRELQVANDDAFVDYLERVVEIMADDPRVLMSAGRYFVKNKNFARAQGFWQILTTLDPTDEEAAFQNVRCLERIGTSVVE